MQDHRKTIDSFVTTNSNVQMHVLNHAYLTARRDSVKFKEGVL